MCNVCAHNVLLIYEAVHDAYVYFRDLVTIAKRQHDVKPKKIRKDRGGGNCCASKPILDT